MSTLRREDCNLIAHLNALDIGYVYHRAIHTYAAYYRGLHAAHLHAPTSRAQVAVEAVGIAYGYCCRYGIALQAASTAIAHRLATREVFELHDARRECSHGDKFVGVFVAVTIESEAQATHVEGRLLEAYDGCRVGEVAKRRIVEPLDELLTHILITIYLRAREVILRRHIRTAEVREYGRYAQRIVLVEHTSEQVYLILNKAQAVHARVELYVYRVVLPRCSVYRMAELIERAEAVNLGFEVVGNHHIEAVVVGIEHHDRHRNTLRA